MIWNLFKKPGKSFLGVDIGTFSIKIVELSLSGNRRKLENYGEIEAEAFYNKPFRVFEKNMLTVSDRDVVRAILAILEATGLKTKKAYFSIPDFSSFFTTFSLPFMTDEELEQAIRYEARRHVPLPLADVTLDWQIIEGGKSPGQKSNSLKILLVAVPNEIIQQYLNIAKNSQLELIALEAEAFGLVRALIKEEEKGPVVLIDIGARSTTISIINNGILKSSHSFNTSGNDFTSAISRGLNVDYKAAEELKKKHGIVGHGSREGEVETNTRELMLPLIDLLLNEAKKISQDFYQTENEKIQQVIIAGGTAMLPGLPEYFSKILEKPVKIGNPFEDIYYPPILDETLKKVGSSYAIALGMALRGLV